MSAQPIMRVKHISPRPVRVHYKDLKPGMCCYIIQRGPHLGMCCGGACEKGNKFCPKCLSLPIRMKTYNDCPHPSSSESVELVPPPPECTTS